MGKIPLVNAELVKALFLRSSNFIRNGNEAKNLQQLNISQEWDSIEKRLQDDAFWYFLSNTPTKTNRIEFVLLLAARHLDSDGLIDSDKLKVFLQFNKLLSNQSVNILQEWLKIKQCFMTLDEWFNDRTLFHLIGYLVSQGVSIGELFDLSKQSETKFGFRQSLLKIIFKRVFGGNNFDSISKQWMEDTLSNLTYESGSHKLRPILLLFNIASLLANPATNARFQFDRYKLDNWDIEHIRSVSSDIPMGKEKQTAWLIEVVDYITEVHSSNLDEQNVEFEQSLRKEAKALLDSSTFEHEIFEQLFNRVRAHYDADSEQDTDESLGNLTLLDRSTNRSYKNSVFPIKRARIIALDKQATFVPLCTKNVFLKYYSKQVDKMLYWGTKDSQDHQAAMVDMLFGFFKGAGVHNKGIHE